jgi:hypothetical protein
MKAYELWRVASTIIGFQILVFGWRIARELRIIEEWNKARREEERAKRAEPREEKKEGLEAPAARVQPVETKKLEPATEQSGPDIWFPIADYLNLLSFGFTIVFVFLVPMTKNYVPSISFLMFGIALILFAAYPFALVGHYQIFVRRKRPPTPPYCSWEEGAIVFLAAIAVVLFICYFL